MENNKNLTKDIENNLRNILEQSLGSVTVLKGRWGIGKTHFIKNFLDKLQIERKTYKFKYVYVSLFNKNSLDDIEKEITIKLYTTVRTISSVKDKIKNLGFILGIKTDDFNLTGSIGSIISLGLSIFENKDFENITIVFDDLERLSKNLSFEEVLGFISVLKEDKNCRVIIIMNDEELGEEKQKIYDTYKEKIVDFEFTYDPTVEENFELIKDRYRCFEEEIKEFFVLNNINNIRNMLQVGYVINRICNLNVNKSLLKESIRYLIPFIYLKKVENKTTKEVIDIFKDYNFYTFTKDSEEEKLSGDITRVINLFSHLESYDKFFYVSFFPDLITPFFKYIDTEILTDDIINEVRFSFEEEIKRRKKLSIKLSFKEEFEKYVHTVNYKDKDFMSHIWNMFKKHENNILEIFSLSELHGWMIEILGRIDSENKNKYEEFFSKVFIKFLNKLYEVDKDKFLEFVKYESIGINTVRSIIKNIPSLEEYYQGKIEEIYRDKSSSCEDIKNIMLRILKHSGYNREDIEILNNVSEKTLRKCIENPEFVEVLLSFVRDQRVSSSFSEFIQKFDNLLENLSKKNPDIRKKIEIWNVRSR